MLYHCVISLCYIVVLYHCDLSRPKVKDDTPCFSMLGECCELGHQRSSCHASRVTMSSLCGSIVMFIDSSDKYDIKIKHNNTI